MRMLFAVLSLALSVVAVAGAQGTIAPPALVLAQSPPVVVGTQVTPSGGGQTRPPTPPVPTPTPTAPVAPQPPRPDSPTVPSVAANVRLELTITDTLTGAPVTKTLTMHIMSGESGQIRSQSPDGRGLLDVDASVRVFQNTMVTTRLTFNYGAVAPPSATPAGRPASLQESITVLLQDGKPLVVSQSADPASDRTVSVELRATIVPIAR